MQRDLETLLAQPGTFGEGVADPVSGRPVEVEAALTLRGRTWERVGLRYKGNSTLAAAARAGSWKLPFRIDMDAFVPDGSLYGIEQVSLGNGARDPTLVRGLLAARWMRAFGIPAPRTRLVAVTLDLHGEPARPLGLYTLAEVPGDALVQSLSGGGTLYEADGPGATLAAVDALAGSIAPRLEGSDGEDVRDAVDALLDKEATPPLWRAAVAGTWDVDGVVRWLAANTVLVNWDTYGVIAHNYYLHGAPDGRVHVLPWDLDEAMRPHPLAPDLRLDEVDGRWPLVRRLMDDRQWGTGYANAAHAFADGPIAHATDDITRACATVRPWVLAEAPGDSLTTPYAFDAGCEELRAHIEDRRALVAEVFRDTAPP
jgi:hypothetical protein